MRGFVCAELGILPNNEDFRKLSDSELVFIHYYLRKKQADSHLFWLREGPKIIGKAIGTFWTYDSLTSTKGGVTCTVCGHDAHTVSRESGEPKLVCGNCGAPWDVEKFNQTHARPSEINIPLAVMIAVASRVKNTNEVFKFVRQNVGPELSKVQGGAPSETMMGARMMDSAHSTKDQFQEIVRQAYEEVGIATSSIDEAFLRADALSGGVSRDRADQKKPQGDKK